MVKVVGLAVSDDEKQAALAGFLGQQVRSVADRGAEAGVVAGVQGGDAAFDGLAHRFFEPLCFLNEDPIPFQ